MCSYTCDSDVQIKEKCVAFTCVLDNYSPLTTESTVTGLFPAELLMGRRLNNKLPRVAIPSDTEAPWQQLRERDVRAKLRRKKDADSKRSAEYSDIEEGDQIRSTRAGITNYRLTLNHYNTK